MGLGLLGRGVGDVAFLAECGAELIVTDLKNREQLASSLKKLEHYSNITYVLEEHRLEDFRNRDMVIKPAGVPLDSVFIAEARKNNIPIEMSTALFSRLTQATLVGITGTRGKSTVTHLIYEILHAAYQEKMQKIYLGGNVRGVSTLAMLTKAKQGDIVVLELDSWQLQGFGEAKISPHVAVFTTFMEDHVNYYKNDIQQYFADKANIYLYQKKSDIVIMGSQLGLLIKETLGTKIVADSGILPKEWNVGIPGEHNRYNIGIAVAATRALGVADTVIQKAVEAYKGVPGRLEFIKKIKENISVYNDTTSTTPDALIVALESLGSNKNIVLIMGGADKMISMEKILDPLGKYTKKIICLPGTGTNMLLKNNTFAALQPTVVKDMFEAVAHAVNISENGNIILLSPGFASFGIFTNEFDRGEQFIKIISTIA